MNISNLLSFVSHEESLLWEFFLLLSSMLHQDPCLKNITFTLARLQKKDIQLWTIMESGKKNVH
jgi:hypothetical protein